jgi:hypothetical protein
MSQLRLKKMLDDIAFDRLPPAWTQMSFSVPCLSSGLPPFDPLL